MKIAIGNDHAGPAYKEAIVIFLESKGIIVSNYGTDTELARLHNNANILSIPARYTSIPQVLAMVDVFLNTKFEGGRHQTRVDKITCS
jgi:ribose 5-phosphate isomerase RpiB